MKTCSHKYSSSGDLCAEEVWKTSDYCILHTDFPKDLSSPDFNVLIEEKNKEIIKRVRNTNFNFEGAKLYELNFSKMEITGDLQFIDAEIKGNAFFDNVKVDGRADFQGIKIDLGVSFQESEFAGDVNFENAELNGDINLYKAIIGGNANFTQALINGQSNFITAHIDGNVNFNKAEINGDTNFTRAIISRDVDFPLAKIGGGLIFQLTRIGGDADFLLATIDGSADFRVKIDGKIDFEKVKIAGDADFEEAVIGESLFFNRSIINGNTNFFMANIGRDAYFTGAEFGGKANFEQAVFKGGVDFQEVNFIGDANFEKMMIRGNSKFQWATFPGYAYFFNSEFKEPVSFNETSFLTKGVFKGLEDFKASFEGAILKNVAFRDCDLTNVRFKYVTFEHCGLSTSYWKDNIIPEHKDYEKLKIQNINTSLLFISNFFKILWIPNLIKDANIASDSYNRIKKSLQEEGDYEKAGKFYIKEMDLKREVYWNDDKLMWIFYAVLSITTNYGESIRRLIICYFGLIFIFAIIYLLFGYSIYNAIIYSALTSVALIYSPAQPNGLQWLSYIERLTGTVFITLFVYVFARKMSR